jgi:hypothetical protein
LSRSLETWNRIGCGSRSRSSMLLTPLSKSTMSLNHQPEFLLVNTINTQQEYATASGRGSCRVAFASIGTADEPCKLCAESQGCVPGDIQLNQYDRRPRP